MESGYFSSIDDRLVQLLFTEGPGNKTSFLSTVNNLSSRGENVNGQRLTRMLKTYTVEKGYDFAKDVEVFGVLGDAIQRYQSQLHTRRQLFDGYDNPSISAVYHAVAIATNLYRSDLTLPSGPRDALLDLAVTHGSQSAIDYITDRRAVCNAFIQAVTDEKGVGEIVGAAIGAQQFLSKRPPPLFLAWFHLTHAVSLALPVIHTDLASEKNGYSVAYNGPVYELFEKMHFKGCHSIGNFLQFDRTLQRYRSSCMDTSSIWLEKVNDSFQELNKVANVIGSEEFVQEAAREISEELRSAKQCVRVYRSFATETKSQPDYSDLCQQACELFESECRRFNRLIEHAHSRASKRAYTDYTVVHGSIRACKGSMHRMLLDLLLQYEAGPPMEEAELSYHIQMFQKKIEAMQHILQGMKEKEESPFERPLEELESFTSTCSHLLKAIKERPGDMKEIVRSFVETSDTQSPESFCHWLLNPCTSPTRNQQENALVREFHETVIRVSNALVQRYIRVEQPPQVHDVDRMNGVHEQITPVLAQLAAFERLLSIRRSYPDGLVRDTLRLLETARFIVSRSMQWNDIEDPGLDDSNADVLIIGAYTGAIVGDSVADRESNGTHYIHAHISEYLATIAPDANVRSSTVALERLTAQVDKEMLRIEMWRNLVHFAKLFRRAPLIQTNPSDSIACKRALWTVQARLSSKCASWLQIQDQLPETIDRINVYLGEYQATATPRLFVLRTPFSVAVDLLGEWVYVTEKLQEDSNFSFEQYLTQGLGADEALQRTRVLFSILTDPLLQPSLMELMIKRHEVQMALEPLLLDRINQKTYESLDTLSSYVNKCRNTADGLLRSVGPSSSDPHSVSSLCGVYELIDQQLDREIDGISQQVKDLTGSLLDTYDEKHQQDFADLCIWALFRLCTHSSQCKRFAQEQRVDAASVLDGPSIQMCKDLISLAPIPSIDDMYRLHDDVLYFMGDITRAYASEAKDHFSLLWTNFGKVHRELHSTHRPLACLYESNSCFSRELKSSVECLPAQCTEAALYFDSFLNEFQDALNEDESEEGKLRTRLSFAASGLRARTQYFRHLLQFFEKENSNVSLHFTEPYLDDQVTGRQPVRKWLDKFEEQVNGHISEFDRLLQHKGGIGVTDHSRKAPTLAQQLMADHIEELADDIEQASPFQDAQPDEIEDVGSLSSRRNLQVHGWMAAFPIGRHVSCGRVNLTQNNTQQVLCSTLMLRMDAKPMEASNLDLPPRETVAVFFDHFSRIDTYKDISWPFQVACAVFFIERGALKVEGTIGGYLTEAMQKYYAAFFSLPARVQEMMPIVCVSPHSMREIQESGFLDGWHGDMYYGLQVPDDLGPNDSEPWEITGLNDLFSRVLTTYKTHLATATAKEAKEEKKDQVDPGAPTTEGSNDQANSSAPIPDEKEEKKNQANSGKGQANPGAPIADEKKITKENKETEKKDGADKTKTLDLTEDVATSIDKTLHVLLDTHTAPTGILRSDSAKSTVIIPLVIRITKPASTEVTSTLTVPVFVPGPVKDIDARSYASVIGNFIIHSVIEPLGEDAPFHSLRAKVVEGKFPLDSTIPFALVVAAKNVDQDTIRELLLNKYIQVNNSYTSAVRHDLFRALAVLYCMDETFATYNEQVKQNAGDFQRGSIGLYCKYGIMGSNQSDTLPKAYSLPTSIVKKEGISGDLWMDNVVKRLAAVYKEVKDKQGVKKRQEAKLEHMKTLGEKCMKAIQKDRSPPVFYQFHQDAQGCHLFWFIYPDVEEVRKQVMTIADNLKSVYGEPVAGDTVAYGPAAKCVYPSVVIAVGPTPDVTSELLSVFDSFAGVDNYQILCFVADEIFERDKLGDRAGHAYLPWSITGAQEAYKSASVVKYRVAHGIKEYGSRYQRTQSDSNLSYHYGLYTFGERLKDQPKKIGGYLFPEFPLGVMIYMKRERQSDTVASLAKWQDTGDCKDDELFQCIAPLVGDRMREFEKKGDATFLGKATIVLFNVRGHTEAYFVQQSNAISNCFSIIVDRGSAYDLFDPPKKEIFRNAYYVKLKSGQTKPDDQSCAELSAALDLYLVDLRKNSAKITQDSDYCPLARIARGELSAHRLAGHTVVAWDDDDDDKDLKKPSATKANKSNGKRQPELPAAKKKADPVLPDPGKGGGKPKPAERVKADPNKTAPVRSTGMIIPNAVIPSAIAQNAISADTVSTNQIGATGRSAVFYFDIWATNPNATNATFNANLNQHYTIRFDFQRAGRSKKKGDVAFNVEYMRSTFDAIVKALRGLVGTYPNPMDVFTLSQLDDCFNGDDKVSAIVYQFQETLRRVHNLFLEHPDEVKNAKAILDGKSEYYLVNPYTGGETSIRSTNLTAGALKRVSVDPISLFLVQLYAYPENLGTRYQWSSFHGHTTRDAADAFFAPLRTPEPRMPVYGGLHQALLQPKTARFSDWFPRWLGKLARYCFLYSCKADKSATTATPSYTWLQALDVAICGLERSSNLGENALRDKASSISEIWAVASSLDSALVSAAPVDAASVPSSTYVHQISLPLQLCAALSNVPVAIYLAFCSDPCYFNMSEDEYKRHCSMSMQEFNSSKRVFMTDIIPQRPGFLLVPGINDIPFQDVLYHFVFTWAITVGSTFGGKNIRKLTKPACEHQPLQPCVLDLIHESIRNPCVRKLENWKYSWRMFEILFQHLQWKASLQPFFTHFLSNVVALLFVNRNDVFNKLVDDTLVNLTGNESLPNRRLNQFYLAVQLFKYWLEHSGDDDLTATKDVIAHFYTLPGFTKRAEEAGLQDLCTPLDTYDVTKGTQACQRAYLNVTVTDISGESDAFKESYVEGAQELAELLYDIMCPGARKKGSTDKNKNDEEEKKEQKKPAKATSKK